MTDNDGKLRIALTSDGVNSSILYRDSEKDDFKEILTTNFKESVSPLFLHLIIMKYMFLQIDIGIKVQYTNLTCKKESKQI